MKTSSTCVHSDVVWIAKGRREHGSRGNEFGGYEAVLRGAADRILRMAESSLEESLALQHRQLDLDQEVTRTAGRTLAREQWLTFIVAVLALVITVGSRR